MRINQTGELQYSCEPKKSIFATWNIYAELKLDLLCINIGKKLGKYVQLWALRRVNLQLRPQLNTV